MSDLWAVYGYDAAGKRQRLAFHADDFEQAYGIAVPLAAIEWRGGRITALGIEQEPARRPARPVQITRPVIRTRNQGRKPEDYQ